jgi:hypothetical protein
MDVDSIPAGDMFNEVIRKAISDADVVLVIVGRNWEGIASDGLRRLDSPDDFVRSEIAVAIELHRRIIPVLVDGARPLPSDTLPVDIALLAFANAIELTHQRWKYDTGRLVDAILGMDEIGRMVASLRAATYYEAIEILQLISSRMSSADPAGRQRSFASLKPLFCERGTEANSGAALHDREVRRQIWSCLRELAGEPVGRYFRHGELSGLDLYGLNFRSAQMNRVAFDRSFLVESDLSGADLEDASLRECQIRNVNLTGARLKDADLTGADWFHSTGLIPDQLAAVRPGSLRPCPANTEAMFAALDGDYAYPFASWTRKVQDDLRATWKRYLEDPAFRPWRAD